MQKKIQTEITKVTLNSPIFTNKSFNPTLVNFIYGTNGTGKSTISRLMDQKDYPGLEFKQPKDDAVIMVYNEDYIRENVQSYGNIPGVFTLTKTNAERRKRSTTPLPPRRNCSRRWNMRRRTWKRIRVNKANVKKKQSGMSGKKRQN